VSAASPVERRTLGRVGLRIVSDSELRTLRACMRRHKYAYVMRRRPLSKSDALAFGTLWHEVLEAWWKCMHGAAEIRMATAVHVLRGREDVDPYTMVLLEELLLAYTARWMDSTLRPASLPDGSPAVEVQFVMHLTNPDTGRNSQTFMRGGKVDVVAVDDATGEEVIVEHKTTASDIEEGSPYLRKVRALDTQVSTYMSGARALGFKPTKCVYDVVRKPALRPLKATPVESRKYTQKGFLYANQRENDESPEEYRLRIRAEIEEKPDRYLARVDIVRLEEEEREHAADVWNWTQILHDAERTGRFPKNPDACGQFGTPCPYLVVCEGMADINDNSLYRTAETEHEELAT
jgi:hypothetical protein